MRVTRADLTTITVAGAEIERLAIEIRQSGSIGGDGVLWDSNRDKRTHDRLQTLAGRLVKLRARLAA